MTENLKALLDCVSDLAKLAENTDQALVVLSQRMADLEEVVNRIIEGRQRKENDHDCKDLG